jgi:N4-gp56 family major capsid protein
MAGYSNSNAFTDTGTGSLGTNLVQAAYDRYVEFALRAIPLIRDVADKRPAQQAMPGSSVVFQLYTDLTKATTPLTETTDPDAVALGNTTSVSVTLNEYGNAALATRKLELFSLSDVDPAIANIIAFNMADSLDELALTELRGGSNVIFSANASGTVPTGTSTVGATNTIKSADIRKAVAKLRAGKAVPRVGELYWVGIHPEVSHDLRAETGAGGWREAHVYNESGAGNLWPGSIGTYEGAMFVESPRLYNATDGAGSVRVFRTILAGQQALAEAVAEEPHVIIGPVVDKLMRFRPIGWYGVLGWKRYREAALYRIESTSSINNA